MADPKQQCNWCLRAYPFISRHFTPVELRVHIQDVHPNIKVMDTRHRCPHEACLDVGDTTFNFAHEVREHLEKVHGGLVGEWKEKKKKKKEGKKEMEEEKGAFKWGLSDSQRSSANHPPLLSRVQESEKKDDKKEELRVRRVELDELQKKHQAEWELIQLARYGPRWMIEGDHSGPRCACGSKDPWRVYSFWDHVYANSAYYERVHGYFGVVPDLTEEQWQAEGKRKSAEADAEARARRVEGGERKERFHRNEVRGKARGKQLRLREEESDRLALANTRHS